MSARDARLAFAIVAPPAAWTFQLLAVYLLVSLACAKHVVVPLGTQAAGAAAALVALAALATALGARDEGDGPRRFLSRAAALAAVLFLGGIILGSLPGVLVAGCA